MKYLSRFLPILIVMFIAYASNDCYSQQQIAFTALKSDLEGSVAWNATGAGPEPAATGHNIPLPICGSAVAYYYVASADYDNLTTSSDGGHFTNILAGFNSFSNELTNQGYNLSNVTFRYGLMSLGADVQGQDWDVNGTVETRHYNGGTFGVYINGELMAGGNMPTLTMTIDYNNFNDCTDDLISGLTGYMIPNDQSANSSAGVQACAAAFLQDLSGQGMRLNFAGLQPAAQGGISGNGRSGGWFEAQNGVLETADICSNYAITLDSISHDDCSNGTGSIYISAPGFSSFSWTPGNMNTEDIIGVQPGQYTVVATQNLTNCVDSATFLIHDCCIDLDIIDTSAVYVTDASCQGGTDGSIYVSVVAGMNNVTYQWLDNPNETTNIRNNLTTGTYTVVVSDGTGTYCPDTMTIIVGEGNNQISGAAFDQTICLGDSVYLYASGGYQASWYIAGDPVPFFVDSFGMGMSYTPTMTNTYYVHLYDSYSNCSGWDTMTITVNNCGCPDLIDTSAVYVTDASCQGGTNGSIYVTVLPGVGNVTYEWLDDNTEITESRYQLSAGTYTVVVHDANGCTDTTTVFVGEDNYPISGAAFDQTICLGDSVYLYASGGYQASWYIAGDAVPFFVDSFGMGMSYTPTMTNTYYVHLYDPYSNCSGWDTMTITVMNCCPTLLDDGLIGGSNSHLANDHYVCLESINGDNITAYVTLDDTTNAYVQWSWIDQNGTTQTATGFSIPVFLADACTDSLLLNYVVFCNGNTQITGQIPVYITSKAIVAAVINQTCNTAGLTMDLALSCGESTSWYLPTLGYSGATSLINTSPNGNTTTNTYTFTIPRPFYNNDDVYVIVQKVDPWGIFSYTDTIVINYAVAAGCNGCPSGIIAYSDKTEICEGEEVQLIMQETGNNYPGNAEARWYAESANGGGGGTGPVILGTNDTMSYQPLSLSPCTQDSVKIPWSVYCLGVMIDTGFVNIRLHPAPSGMIIPITGGLDFYPDCPDHTIDGWFDSFGNSGSGYFYPTTGLVGNGTVTFIVRNPEVNALNLTLCDTVHISHPVIGTTSPPSDSCLITWEDPIGTTVSSDGKTLTKIATTTGWDAGAVDTDVLPAGSDGWIQMEVLETNTLRMFGFAMPNTNTANTIDYAFRLRTTANFQIYENGVSKGFFGGYSTGDIFRIERVGGVINYLHNGMVIYTSATTSTTDLVADVSMKTFNGTIYNAYASYGCDNPCDDFEIVTLQLQDESCIGANDGVFAIGQTGSNPITVAKYKDGQPYNTPTAYDLPPGNYLYIATDDVTGCVDSLMETINPGTTTCSDSCLITWTDFINTAMIGNKRLKKTIASPAWDAAALSQGSLTSGDNGWVQMEAQKNNKRMVFGLAWHNTSADKSSIRFGIELHSNGNVYIRENGHKKYTGGTYAAGDIFRVEKTGNVVTYYHNGTLLYTSTKNAYGTYYADVSIKSTGAKLYNAYASFGCSATGAKTAKVPTTYENIETEKQQITFDDATAYPNPFNSEMTINYASNVEAVKSIELYDINGQHIRSIEISQDGQTTVDTSDLVSGLYIISINGVKHIKVVKM